MAIQKGPYGQMQDHIDAAVAGLSKAKGSSQQQAGKAAALPHQAKIQASFGKHDVSGVQAHTGAGAMQATQAMGAAAYATGNHVAFAGPMSSHTMAHEAAHVVQQRGGAVQQKSAGGGQSAAQEAKALAQELAHSNRAPHQGRVVVTPPSPTATVAQSLSAAQATVKNLANLEQAGVASQGSK